LRVYVYAICKNEEKHAARWMRSMSEADGVYVLDTGSDDGSVGALRELGAVVMQRRIEPWRFDTARNISMEMIPQDADICVCTDLDEVFRPGWREGFERIWRRGRRMRAVLLCMVAQCRRKRRRGLLERQGAFARGVPLGGRGA